MDLIERYLQNVKLALPKSQQTDVIRELTDEIFSRVEEKESALGRRLTEDEQVTLLKQMGHPMMLATRYRKRQYLIGPALFPIYWIVLRLILLIVVFGMSIGSIALAATGNSVGASLRPLGQLPTALIATFAWVTIVFALLERFEAKFNLFSKWDPRTLPAVPNRAKRPSTTDSVAGLIFGAIFGVWWLVALKHQFWIFGPGAAFLHFGPVWQTLYPLFVVLILIDLLRHGLNLFRPTWEKVRAALSILYRAGGLVVLLFLLNAPDLLVAGEAAQPEIQPALHGINHVAHLGVIVAIVVTIAQAAWELYRHYFRDKRNDQQATVSL